MRRLNIRNIGPIKDVDIDLRRFNFIIGPQSSGKSTIAKILSTCSWVEKEVATTMDEHVIADAAAFRSLMVDFHKMTDYFEDDSEILFETDVVKISFKGEVLNVRLKNQELYHREKICYIPSERNAVTLPELQGYEFGPTNLRSFLFDWFNAREFYKKDNKADILNLGVRYFYDPDEQKFKDRIEHINGKTYQIPLGSASSGLQSVIPLQIMLQYYANQYFRTFADKTAFDADVKTRLIQARIIDKYVLNVAYPGFNPADRSKLIKEQNDRIHEGNPTARKLLDRYRKELDRLTVPVRTSFIVEEPEQNLYPSTQRDLLNFIVANCNSKNNHSLTITTHSPYVINQLNLLLKAADKNGTVDGAAISFDDINVMAVQEGNIRDLKVQNENVHLIDTARLSEDITDIYERYGAI